MSFRRLVGALVLSLCASSLLAQATGTTTGDIRGRVNDESGAALPGVTVTATGQETGLARSDTSAKSKNPSTIRRVAPLTHTVFGLAALSIRLATWTASPTRPP